MNIHDPNIATPKVTTGQIYWGAVPFVVIQLIMVSLIIAFPALVTSGLEKTKVFDTNQMRIDVPAEVPRPGGPDKDSTTAGQPGAEAEKAGEDDDPSKAIERAMRGDAAKPPADDAGAKPADAKKP